MEGWLSIDLCVLYQGLEHLWVLVSVGSPGTDSLWTPRGDCSSM